MKYWLFFFLFSFLHATPQYYCTAANAPYFHCLLNLIGSLHASNFEDIEEIAVFDLGLRQEQIERLNKIQKVAVYRELPSELLQDLKLFAWKPAAIKKSLKKFPYVLWLDAGTTVLRSLEPLFAYLATHPHFLCTIGEKPLQHPIGWASSPFLEECFHLDSENRWILDQEPIMGGIIGVSRSADFLDDWDQRDLRYFASDRHDQTLLSILAYSKHLPFFHQDPKQREPMPLPQEPFYITWHPSFINEKTHIYSSRGDLRHLFFYLTSIRWKSCMP